MDAEGSSCEADQKWYLPAERCLFATHFSSCEPYPAAVNSKKRNLSLQAERAWR